jgi:YVTN family beta-propeller protein
MSALLLKKSPFSSEEDSIYPTLTNRLQWQWAISVLQLELERICAWNRVQQKKEDGQYLTQAGKYLKVGFDLVCSDEVRVGLRIVLMFLEAEATAAKKWQEFVYVTNGGFDTVSVIATANDEVIDTIPVEGNPRGVAITPDGTKAYVVSSKSHDVSVIATDGHKVIATIPVTNGWPSRVAISPDGTTMLSG